MNKEVSFRPTSGFLILFLWFVLAGAVAFGILMQQFWAGAGLPVILLMLAGFFVVQPNKAAVLTFFGKYKGTVRDNGFFWVNPFFKKATISLRARNLEGQPIKVNDKLGNPILIGVVLVWRVRETFKASFEVEGYENFVKLQSDAAVRQLAGAYPYDNFDDTHHDLTLRSGGEEVNHQLEQALSHRLEIAGIEVMEARISNLAYSSEIAGAMLQRQQATAVVAARHKIVEGAVGMVEMALTELSKKQIVELDDDKKAAMVSNLMVVLCSERAASPVVNTGTLHQ